VAWLIPKWLNVEGISVKADKTGKESRGRARSEAIIKKVKGMMPSSTKHRQCMATPRAHETGKQRYQQAISIIVSLLSVNSFVFSCQTSNC